MKKIFLYVAFVCASFLSTAEACDGNIVDVEVDVLTSVKVLLEKKTPLKGTALFESIALEIFPTKTDYYSPEKFLANFKPFIHEGLWGDFQQGWAAIYEGKIRLSAERETKHIRCLFSKILFMWCAREKSSNNWLERQKATVYSRFSASDVHMNLLKIHAPDLFKKV